MKIAIIGTGNVGAALAKTWANNGHEVNLGVKDISNFKGQALLGLSNVQVYPVVEAASRSEVILLATPATAAVDVARSLGDTSGKVIIDAMNIIAGRGPAGYKTTTDAVLDNTATRDVVKCFNTTGFNNMANPVYNGVAVDMFVAGDSAKGKAAAIFLSKEAGFADCIPVGGNDKFELLEQFAWFWINLAMFQGQGREIAFKLLKR